MRPPPTPAGGRPTTPEGVARRSGLREPGLTRRIAPNLGNPVAEVTLSQTPAGSNNRVFGYIGLGIAALLLVGVTAVFFWPRGGSTSKPGRVEAEPARMDLGRVPFDEARVATFELVNVGGGPVRLLGKPQVTMREGC